MLYVLRHGRTDWNRDKRLQGNTDIPLNEEGREMARRAAQRFRDVPLDICYCSPLLRARETAQLFLTGRDVPIVTDDRLREMNFGVMEGLAHWADLTEGPIFEFLRHPGNYAGVENGESIDDLWTRTGAFLRDRVEPDLAAGKRVLIVGHFVMNACLTCRVRGLSPDQLWSVRMENCELVRLR